MGHSLVKEFITEDYQASVQTVLDKALDGVETANFEFPLITKAGGKSLKVLIAFSLPSTTYSQYSQYSQYFFVLARIEVLLNATTRRNEHGKVIGVVGIGQDITARLAQEREYSKLIDNANAPIFGVDTQGRVNVWNQCAMKLVGFPMNEVMGKVRTSPLRCLFNLDLKNSSLTSLPLTLPPSFSLVFRILYKSSSRKSTEPLYRQFLTKPYKDKKQLTSSSRLL